MCEDLGRTDDKACSRYLKSQDEGAPARVTRSKCQKVRGAVLCDPGQDPIKRKRLKPKQGTPVLYSAAGVARGMANCLRGCRQTFV